MSVADDIKYHGDRAMAELDLASRADHPRVARIHLALSELHLDRMRALSASSPTEPVLTLVS
jgi:hypothetical protein